MAIELYTWPHSSGTRVAWALEELGVPYAYIEVDRRKEEQLSPRFLALNPHGKIPALVDDGKPLFESTAILLHLGDKYGVERDLWPAPGAAGRAETMCWTVWAGTELWPHLIQFLYHGLDTPVSFPPEERSHAAAQYSLSELNRNLDSLEARLGNDDYLFGRFSLADVATAGVLAVGTRLGFALDRHPHTAAWCSKCTERPSFKRAS